MSLTMDKIQARIMITGLMMIANSNCLAMQSENQQEIGLVEVLNPNQASSGIILSLLSNKDIANLHLAGRDLYYVWDHSRKINFEINKWKQQLRFLERMNARNPVRCLIEDSDVDYTIRKLTRLHKYPNVQKLIINSCSLTSLPEELQFPHLKTLILVDSHFDSDTLSRLCQVCPELEELELSGNGLSCVVEQIKNLTKLKKLSLMENQLTQEAVAQLCEWCPQLEELDLRSNGLETLPAQIGTLKQLKKLNLAMNQLDSESLIPIGRCTNLEELDLFSNEITSLPVQMRDLKRLRTLNLGFNPCTLDMIVQLCELCPQLSNLDLSSNKLTSLPVELRNLTQLKRLSLSGLFTAETLAPICGCSQLEELHLQSNGLTSLPLAIGDLKQLKELFLQGNHLTGHALVPLCECTELRRLSLLGNKIRHFPEQIQRLTKLKDINLFRCDKLKERSIQQLQTWLPDVFILSEFGTYPPL